MKSHVHLDEVMQTTCLFCGSVFRVTQAQLDKAHGKVRCGICNEQFNALLTLENYHRGPGETPSPRPAAAAVTTDADAGPTAPDPAIDEPVSLQAAIYGDADERRRNRQWLWGAGILALLLLLVVQVVYYLRYELVADPRYQQQVLNLCRLLPCDEQRFHSPQQVRLTERNVFTHPTRDHALLISGRLVNQAPFAQRPPLLRISLSDLQGNLIADRLFKPEEYLTDPDIQRLPPGRAIPFRLEIFDPDEKALTYEFDFVS
jgi:predicted Zn finger-like uncharacterized protein